MKFPMMMLFVLLSFGQFAEAYSLCGKAAGFSYNQDSVKRPYKLSGFWLKQNTEDIRITYGHSPELIQFVEELEGSIFVCLDKYELVEKKYSGKRRTYAKVQEFRVWLNGNPVPSLSGELRF